MQKSGVQRVPGTGCERPPGGYRGFRLRLRDTTHVTLLDIVRVYLQTSMYVLFYPATKRLSAIRGFQTISLV